MNQAVFQFRRYEDSSLSYTGINKHAGEVVGGWDTTISYADMKKNLTIKRPPIVTIDGLFYYVFIKILSLFSKQKLFYCQHLLKL